MEALQRVKFDIYDRADILNGSRSVEQILTEAILHIQRNIRHQVIHSEVTHRPQDDNGWLKKGKAGYTDVTLKVVVRVMENEG